MLQEPSDFIGNILAKLLNHKLENELWAKRLDKWKMSIVLDTDYYPVSMVFGDKIVVVADYVKNPTLVLMTKFSIIIDLFSGKTSMIVAILKRSVKTRGSLRHPRSMYRFYKLMSSILGG